MISSPSIAILTCWYGEYPWYFPYFIKSCQYNPTIDFIILTDNTTVIPNKPENLKIIYKTLEEFKINASAKLGFKVTVDTPYKLCDFKPAYGFLFPEIIAPYSFWGHGDIDMVYGNVRGFMTDEILESHDVLTSREDITMGTFCLYRNTDQMNKLFMTSRDYEFVFTHPEHFCFDECNFLFRELAFGHSILDYPKNIQSMTYLVVKGSKEGDFRAFFDRIMIQGMSNRIRWDNGLVIFNNRYECMFYDLIDYKVKCKNKRLNWSVPDVFYFNRKGINKNSITKLLFVKAAARLKRLMGKSIRD